MATAYAAGAALVPRLSATKTSSSYGHRASALAYLPPRFLPSSLAAYIKQPQFSDYKRLSLFMVKSSSSEETSSSIEVGEVFSGLKEKWDALENKTTVILYGGGAIVAVWLSSIIVDAINSIPLLPKILELVGLGYSGWFVYRYLLFKSSRQELASDIEALKKKIAGSE